jgi:hypothetical protein
MAPAGKPIVAIAADGSSRQTYATVRKAAEATGVPHATIARGAKSLAKHGAFFFKFDSDPREPTFEQAPTITAEDRARAQALFHSLSGKDGNLITELRLSDGFVNATKMCRSATLAEGVEKKFSNFYGLQGTSNYILALSHKAGYLPHQLVQVGSGGQSTFVHPKLAIYLAQWCSADFAVEVSELVFRYLMGDLTTGESLAAAQEVQQQTAAPKAPTVTNWHNLRQDGVKMYRGKTDAIQDYIAVRTAAHPGEEDMSTYYAMVNNLINQALLDFQMSTREYKDAHGIPQSMTIPDMFDGHGQVQRMNMEYMFFKYFTDREDQWARLNPWKAFNDLKGLRDKFIRFRSETGMDDLSTKHMLDVVEAKKRKRERAAIGTLKASPALKALLPGPIAHTTNNNTINKYYVKIQRLGVMNAPVSGK